MIGRNFVEENEKVDGLLLTKYLKKYSAIGNSKKDAEQNAAKKLISYLKL